VRYREASTAINNRNELVAEVAERIEQNLILLGATGIEDKLQDVMFAISHLITSFIFSKF
jgi:phospholipid-translocating ATPase